MGKDIEYKVCPGCGKELPKNREYFYVRNSARDGFSPRCKECIKVYQLRHMKTDRFKETRKKYRQQEHVKNKEAEYGKEYRKTENFKNSAKKYRDSEYGKKKRREYKRLEYVKKANRQYARRRYKEPEVREYQNEWRKEKYKTSFMYNFKNKIGSTMAAQLRKSGGKKKSRWLDLTGYSLDDLKERLYTTMPSGYSWQDFLNGDLHIDHIYPISKFTIHSIMDESFRLCWSLENLQLLPASENIRKSNKIKKVPKFYDNNKQEQLCQTNA